MPIRLLPNLSGSRVFPSEIKSKIMSSTHWDNESFSRYFKGHNFTGPLPFRFFFFEKLLAFLLLVLIFPVFSLLVVLVKCTSRGPVFFKQVRTGYRGKIFSVLKFRTMVENAEAATGATLSWQGDPRITPIGNILRKCHLDELPQLINIINGEMSFIGPRPERPIFTDKYNAEIEHYALRELVRPGITGLAQICCPYDATAAQKLKFDLLYAFNRRSLLLNFMIAYYTVKKMLFFKKSIGFNA